MNCGTEIGHAVTAIGYGVENGDEYIIIKNSWGTSWGENGFGKILLSTYYSKQGICGSLTLGVMSGGIGKV